MYQPLQGAVAERASRKILLHAIGYGCYPGVLGQLHLDNLSPNGGVVESLSELV